MFGKILVYKRLMLPFLIIFILSIDNSYSQVKYSDIRNNVRYNKITKLPDAVYNINSRQYSGPPEKIAADYIMESKDLLGIDYDNIEVVDSKKNSAGWHICFIQKYKRINVLRSEIVVSINNDSRVSMITSGYKPNINMENKVNN